MTEQTLTGSPDLRKYSPCQKAGERRRQWIENSNDQSCPIGRSQLTLDIVQNKYDVDGPLNEGNQVSSSIRNSLASLGLPTETDSR